MKLSKKDINERGRDRELELIKEVEEDIKEHNPQYEFK